jgi:hypothetical protein
MRLDARVEKFELAYAEPPPPPKRFNLGIPDADHF